MYCDRCGSSLHSGAQFCAMCGKSLSPGPVSRRPAAAVSAGGRVGRHIQLLAGLCLASGVLRLLGVFWLMAAGRLFFPLLRGWNFTTAHVWGLNSLFWGGLYSTGILLGMFGLVYLLLAWGLYEREPWARMLGIVVGFLSLLRIPLGTALGAYTLWVLLPESSAREYDELARSGGQLNSARTSS